MGQRSRKRRSGATAVRPPASPAATPPARPDPDASMRRGYARAEARNQEVRAQLRPFAPGERPLVLTISAAVAILIAVGNVVLYATGYEVRSGQQPTVATTVIFAGIMVAAGVGMWLKRYWAVLGFQALLGVTIISATFSLVRASNLPAALLTTAVIAIAGTLFWFLIKVMARIQTPQRPSRDA